MEKDRLTKAAMATRMRTSRRALDRLLDPPILALHCTRCNARPWLLAASSALNCDLAKAWRIWTSCAGCRLSVLPFRRPGKRNYLTLTRGFRKTISERAQRELRFRKALLREAVELMLATRAGRAILRNYINATVGFRQLEVATSIPANSLMRMFGPKGNPSAKNLLASSLIFRRREA